MRDYRTDHNLAQEYNDVLNAAYREKFPVKEIEEIPEENAKLQVAGVDKIITLDTGRKLLIEEKVRREYYEDILLEEYSNYETKREGWLGDGKLTDYLVYAFPNSQLFYMFPFLLLKWAWDKNKDSWIKDYGRKTTKNDGYTTTFVCVPTEELLKVMYAPKITSYEL